MKCQICFPRIINLSSADFLLSVNIPFFVGTCTFNHFGCMGGLRYIRRKKHYEQTSLQNVSRNLCGNNLRPFDIPPRGETNIQKKKSKISSYIFLGKRM